MSNISKPNTFSTSTPISSSQVNANFDTIYNDYNGGISEANLADDAVTTDKVADDAITGAKIADATVTPANLTSGTGTSWAWQSWTPTWTNLTVGNGTNGSKYTQIGKTVHFKAMFTLGSTSAVSSNIQFTLPVTGVSFAPSTTMTVGMATYFDSSAPANQIGITELISTTTGQAIMMDDGPSFVVRSGVSSTIPFTWATGDVVIAEGTYEAA